MNTFRKIAVPVVLFLAVTALSQGAGAREMRPPANSAVDAVSELEIDLWGAAKDGSALDRTSALELELFAKTENGPLLPRIEKLKEYLTPGHANGMAARVSQLELALVKRVDSEALLPRLSKVEKALSGGSTEGSLLTRLDADLRSVGLENQVASSVTIPQDTPVQVRLVKALNSKDGKANDTIMYEVVKNVSLNGVTVIGAGALGYAHVVSRKSAGSFGRDAHLSLDFCTVVGVDGSLIPLSAKETTFSPPNPDRSLGIAVGAGTAGAVLLGPAGVVGSAVVRGRDVVFPAGTEFELTTVRATTVTALAPSKPN